jgi:hypothetical protein
VQTQALPPQSHQKAVHVCARDGTCPAALLVHRTSFPLTLSLCMHTYSPLHPEHLTRTQTPAPAHAPRHANDATGIPDNAAQLPLTTQSRPDGIAVLAELGMVLEWGALAQRTGHGAYAAEAERPLRLLYAKYPTRVSGDGVGECMWMRGWGGGAPVVVAWELCGSLWVEDVPSGGAHMHGWNCAVGCCMFRFDHASMKAFNPV